MAFDLEEQEKIDQLKAWWERWGNLITNTLLVVMFALAAWYGWGWYKDRQSSKALAYYDVVVDASNTNSEKSVKRTEEAFEVLKKDYSDTVYTGRAALIASKVYSDHQDYEKANKALDWLLDKEKTYKELQAPATLQKATVLSELEQYDEALGLLESAPEGFEALFSDRKGDVLFVKGDHDQAITAWNNALEQEKSNANFKSAINLKLNVLSELNYEKTN